MEPGDVFVQKDARKGFARELAALAGVEDAGPAPLERALQRNHAGSGVQAWPGPAEFRLQRIAKTDHQAVRVAALSILASSAAPPRKNPRRRNCC